MEINIGEVAGRVDLYTNTVVIRSESDFPAKEDNSIPLAEDTTYLIQGEVEISSGFKMPRFGSVAIRGAGDKKSLLKMPGGGVMFISDARLYGTLSLTNCAFEGTTSATFLNTGGVHGVLIEDCNIDTFGSLGLMTAKELLLRNNTFDRIHARAMIDVDGRCLIEGNKVCRSTMGYCITLLAREDARVSIRNNLIYSHGADTFPGGLLLVNPDSSRDAEILVVGNEILYDGNIFDTAGLTETSHIVTSIGNSHQNTGNGGIFENSNASQSVQSYSAVGFQGDYSPVTMNGIEYSGDRFNWMKKDRKEMTLSVDMLCSSTVETDISIAFMGGKNGAGDILSFEQSGMRLKIRVKAHGFAVGDIVVIDGTENYNGMVNIVGVPDADHFLIFKAFSVAETTGLAGKVIAESRMYYKVGTDERNISCSLSTAMDRGDWVKPIILSEDSRPSNLDVKENKVTFHKQ